MLTNMARRKKGLRLKLKSETINSVVAVGLMLMGVLSVVAFTGQGAFLRYINRFLTREFGLAMFFFPFVFISAGLVMMRTKWAWSKPHVLLGTILLQLSALGLLRAGDVGEKTFLNLAVLLSPPGTYAVFSAIGVVGLLLLGQWSLAEIVDWIVKSQKERKKAQLEKEKAMLSGVQPTEEEIKQARGFSLPKLSFPLLSKKQGFEVNDTSAEVRAAAADVTGTAIDSPKKSIDVPVQTLPSDDSFTPAPAPVIWEYPPLSLLSNNPGGKADRGNVKENAEIIESTLESFGISAKVREVNNGPSVTQYALEITRKGTKLSRITSLATDMALALAAPTGQVRIEAPIVGRSLVGIEVPNRAPEYVTLRTMLGSPELKKHPSKLAVALGINVSGKPVVLDIAKMPHILIAGSTGSGKSVAINAFMASILFRASPAEVQFILVDPKRVELTQYNDIPHLLTPVIVEPNKVVAALKWATNLMDKRYKQLAEVGVKNIDSYNELAGHAAMPAVLIVIDELADVMLFSPNEVEESITRIAQMARAVGIHLVLSTQRPSVDVITGLIKANIPARIAFNVSSQTDSRVIIDTPGAEKMLGRGDMLFMPPDQAKPARLQGTYVSDNETKSLIDFIKSQGHKPEYQEEITTKYTSTMGKGSGSIGSDATNADGRDPLFDEAVRLFAREDKASSSLIQRRLSVGYARAARILDQLYENGLVGPPDGSKPRDVNMTKMQQHLAVGQQTEATN